MLKDIIDAITSGITNIYNFLVNINDNVGQWFLDLCSDIGNFFSELGSNLSNLFSNLISNMGSNFSNLGTNLSNWLSYINPTSENFLGIKLIEMLSNLFNYLFVPTEDTVTELKTTIDSKFGFIDSIELAINDIKDMIENIENGTSEFTVDIDSKYYVGEVVLFDLSWYKPFKAYGDLVFTGFAYVFFVWRLWKAIPGIINGTSSITDSFIGGGNNDN